MSRFTHYKKQTVNVANDDAAFMATLAGRTVGEVGLIHQLEGDEFEWFETPNPKREGEVIRGMFLTIEGKEWQIGISRGFKWEKKEDEDWLMDCEFRMNPINVVIDGVVQKDDKGNNIRYDGLEGRALKMQINIGNPSGLTKGETQKAFNTEYSDAKTANKALA